MKRIAAVIFDLDGVLVDATEWHYEALNKALALFGFSITRYEHLTNYNGLPTLKKLEMLTIEKNLPRSLHSLIFQLKQKYTMEEVFTKCQPSFPKELMTKRLRRDGLRLAVCSNAIRASVEMMLRCSGLIQDFEIVLSNEDVQRPKPDPEIYVYAMDRLGLEAEEVAIVEDAPPGVEAGRRSGAHVCAVTGFDDVDYFRVRSFLDSVEGNHVEHCDPVGRERPAVPGSRIHLSQATD